MEVIVFFMEDITKHQLFQVFENNIL